MFIGHLLHGGVPTVKTNLMSAVSHFAQLLGERLDAVARHEPRCFDTILVVHLQQSINADSRSINTTRHVGRSLLRAITGVDPVRDCINVDPVANEYSLLAHSV